MDVLIEDITKVSRLSPGLFWDEESPFSLKSTRDTFIHAILETYNNPETCFVKLVKQTAPATLGLYIARIASWISGCGLHKLSSSVIEHLYYLRRYGPQILSSSKNFTQLSIMRNTVEIIYQKDPIPKDFPKTVNPILLKEDLENYISYPYNREYLKACNRVITSGPIKVDANVVDLLILFCLSRIGGVATNKQIDDISVYIKEYFKSYENLPADYFNDMQMLVRDEISLRKDYIGDDDDDECNCDDC